MSDTVDLGDVQDEAGGPATPMPTRTRGPRKAAGDSRTMGADISSQASSGAAAIDAQHRAVKDRAAETGTAVVVLPNGELGLLTDYVDHEFLSADHTSIFANPARFMKHPEPGYMYVWAAKDGKNGQANAYTVAAIRSHKYRPVEKEELRDDCDLPMETYKMAGKPVVGMLDVVLMAVSPEAAKKMYRWHENMAVLKTQRVAAFEDLKERVGAMTGGAVDVEYEQKGRV